MSTLRSIIKEGKEGNGDREEGSGDRPFSGVGTRLARRLTSVKAPDRSPRIYPGSDGAAGPRTYSGSGVVVAHRTTHRSGRDLAAPALGCLAGGSARSPLPSSLSPLPSFPSLMIEGQERA